MPLDVDVPVCILQELSPSVKAAVTFFSQVAAYAASLLYGGDLFAYLSNSQTVWRGRRTPGHDLEGANAARWFDPSGTGSPGQPGKEAALHLFYDFWRRRLLSAS